MNENNTKKNSKKEILKYYLNLIDTNKLSKKLDNLAKDIKTIREEVKSSYIENSLPDEKNK